MLRFPGIFNKIAKQAVYHMVMLATGLLSNQITRQTNHEGDAYFVTGIRFHYGYVFAHTKSIEAAAYSNPLGIQAGFNWHITTRNAFNYCGCYPRLGVSLYYWDSKVHQRKADFLICDFNRCFCKHAINETFW